MSDTLLDISKKIEPYKLAILAGVDRTARKLNIPFFVIGASARDFILQNGYDISTPRATLDVDIGVSISSWDQFRQLIEILLADEHYKKTAIEHRFESPTPQKTLVDILPFGAIEEANRNIQWPHENREMNMAGFSEAYRMAVDVKISAKPSTVVKMVSIAGFALLKLLSWNEKPNERDRDARDFRLVMYKFLETQPTEYVYDVYPDIASLGDYDLISARSLGRDMADIAGSILRPVISDILIRECNPEGGLRFVQQMQALPIHGEMTINRDITMLNALLQGVSDKS